MKQLQNVSVVAPGFYGLNTQDSSVTLSTNFALTADNCIIDKYGRLGSRKGWTMETTDGSTELSGATVKFMMEHVNNDNSVVVLSGGNNKVFSGGVGAALTDITPSLYTITANNWKGASLYSHAMIVQDGFEPLVYNSTSSPVCQTMTDYTSLTQNYSTSYPRDVIAAWGRFWVHDGETVYWSTDIADTNFPAFYGGTSGTLNISAVLPNNTDTIVALAAHNNFLIIFCKNNIVLYQNADNPIAGDFSVADVIIGTGCVARDSVQSTGNDLIFLSDNGIRSLGRLIQEKSLPMRDLTRNIKDDFVQIIKKEQGLEEDMRSVRSAYSEQNAFYLISFPSSSLVYCLDMRQALEDGSARITRWVDYTARSFLRRRNRDLLVGKVNGIGKYTGYQDNGSSYILRYYSNHIDMQNPTMVKMLKRIKATVVGGNNQEFIVKAGYDYQGTTFSYPFTIVTGNIAEYTDDEDNVTETDAKYVGYAEFEGYRDDYASLPESPSDGDAYMTIDNNNVYQWDAGASAWNDITSTWESTFTVVSSSEYSLGVLTDDISTSTGGAGNVIQIGFETEISSQEFSVQRLDIFVKTGRMI